MSAMGRYRIGRFGWKADIALRAPMRHFVKVKHDQLGQPGPTAGQIC